MKELKSAVMGMAMNPAQFANIPPPPSELVGIFGGLLSGQNDPKDFIEMIKTRDRAKQVTRYLRQCFPPVYQVMVTKRDVHMANMLRRHCFEGKVVAVVGMAHVEGIEQAWEELDIVPNIKA
jgi:pheromone shutdown protein TraB